MFWTRVTGRSTFLCASINPTRYSLFTPSLPGRIFWHSTLNVKGTRPISSASLENSKVEHSQFLANASTHSKWKDAVPGNGTTDTEDDELSDIEEGIGKLLPTTSHLFKLILPLGRKGPNDLPIPIVLLLHPSQPLSHTGRLILASLPRITENGPSISFRSTPSTSSPQDSRQFEWSDSTDIGDFIRNAARAAEFSIHITPDASDGEQEQVITVRVPTFADRTRFLRRQLDAINYQLATMEGLKRECDREARKGARRMALGGFGMLVVYWAAVARLTFWDYGWDIMEPITYLSGLSTVICGYLWFLYQGREVSYTSVLDRSVSSRREALYEKRGLDIEKWMELVSEKKHLMREIGQIKEDYEQPRGEKDKDEKASDKAEADGEEKNSNPLHETEEEKESERKGQ